MPPIQQPQSKRTASQAGHTSTSAPKRKYTAKQFHAIRKKYLERGKPWEDRTHGRTPREEGTINEEQPSTSATTTEPCKY